MKKGDFVMVRQITTATYLHGGTQARERWCACVVASATRQGRAKKLARLDDRRCWQYISGAPAEFSMGKPPLLDVPESGVTTIPHKRALDAWVACLLRPGAGATFDDIDEAREFVRSLPA